MTLWSQAVRSRAGNKCEVCGRVHGDLNAKGNPIRINAHHIEDKANYALRFDIMNGVALCPTCHRFGQDSAHRSPIWFLEWLKEHLRDRYGHVWAMRATPPPDKEGMDEIVKTLHSYVKETNAA